MEWYLALTLLLGTVCVLMFLGLPVALAFFAANVLGTYLFISGDIGLVWAPARAFVSGDHLSVDRIYFEKKLADH